MRALLIALSLSLATGAAAVAAVPDKADEAQPQRGAARDSRLCFNARLASGFRPVGRDQVDITVPGRRVYRLDLGPGCDVDRGLRLALVSRTGSFICSALDAEIVAPSSFGRGVDRCQVVGLRQLSEAEARASRRR